MWKVQESLKGRWGGKPQQEPLKGQLLLLTVALINLVFYLHVWHRCCCCFVFKNLIVHVGVRFSPYTKALLALWCSTEGLNTPQAPRSQVGGVIAFP